MQHIQFKYYTKLMRIVLSFNLLVFYYRLNLVKKSLSSMHNFLSNNKK